MKIPIKINYETELEISDKSFKDDVQDMLEYHLSEHEVAVEKLLYNQEFDKIVNNLRFEARAQALKYLEEKLKKYNREG